MRRDRTTPGRVLGNISVVIPTLGRPILEQCLDSIVAGTAWPARIIVTDQSASTAVAGWLERVGERGVETLHLRSNQRGRARGINRAIERVETRFLAITDDDCRVHPKWLAAMESRLSSDPMAVVTGRVDAMGDEPIALVVDSDEPAVYRRPRLKFDSISGGNMGTSLDVIERVGPLDEDARLQCAEDGEWAYRVLRAGIPIIYAPEVVVAHYGWRTREERIAQFRSYARSHGGFYGKYLRKGDWFIGARALLHHVRSLRRWIRGVRTGDPELALIGRAYFTGLLPGILAGLHENPEASPVAEVEVANAGDGSKR